METYEIIKSQLKSFDLIAFRGSEFVSNTISKIETFEDGTDMGKFTHVGIIIKGDIFPISSHLYDPNITYLFESTMSGNLNGGVLDVNGESFLGVQLRRFDEIVKSVNNNHKAYMALCKLKNEYYLNIDFNKWDEIYEKYNGAKYDINCIDLLASTFKCLRWLRKICSFCCCKHEKPWMFCSELVATIYQDLKIIPDNIDARNVIPCDLIYQTNNFPDILEKPIMFNKN